MLRFLRRRWLSLTLALIVIAGIGAGAFWYLRPAGITHEEPDLPSREQAPPDLQKLRDAFAAGREALQRDDGADAVRHLASFDFGSRAVEEYRLYYLANGHQLAGNNAAARIALARLDRRDPNLIYAADAAFNLGALYSSAAAWRHAGDVYAGIVSRSKNPAISAAARWNAVGARFNEGDISGALFAARNLVIHNPTSKEADDAIALIRAIDGRGGNDALRLTVGERLTRAEALIAANEAAKALTELDALAAVAPSDEVQLQRGIALHRLKRFEDSIKILEPLTSGVYKTAIPALTHEARNYAIVSAAIDPTVIKVVKEKKRVGTIKQRVGKGKKRRTVTKPKYAIVSKQIKLVDLAKRKKKDEYDRLAGERLKDLLQLPLSDEQRLQTLESLADRAVAKKQSDYLRELVPQILKLDVLADPALQFFWDRAWTQYSTGDLASAKTLFRFISDTYTNPAIKRQCDYWYARTVERLGQKDEAKAIYQRLANAPYADVYALHSVQRGAKRTPDTSNPLERKDAVDWREIAEKNMPRELRLAYELGALSAMRESFLEVRANASRRNARFAEALYADVYHQAGNPVLMYRSLKRAWPQIATPDQDSVPPYFLQMYYPVKYVDDIRKYAARQKLDPHLVQGLILQESYYNPKARSRVGATGLMQLMPPTAEEHSRRLGIVFGKSRLENPDVNIQLGTFHLRMLINLFGGNEYLAIASYNGGQGNVMKWRRAAPRKPMDEFLESIPFDETRGYVKRVTMLRAAYERITP